MPDLLRRCCVPSLANLTELRESTRTSTGRKRAVAGSLEDMVGVGGGSFEMGSDAPYTLPEDGEGPVVRVRVDPFHISRYTVTNERFGAFVERTGYRTEAERFGWSLVFRHHVVRGEECDAVPGTPWWLRVYGAWWRQPEGPGSDIGAARASHPVVHVSWNDAQAYCDSEGVRLPTEAEWEFSARGGLEQKTYPWGDELLLPGGVHRCNIWQGAFPDRDLGEDGFCGTAPADAFGPNDFGLFNCVGNVWEWCADYFGREQRQSGTKLNPCGPAEGAGRVLKGGSYLCHQSYCSRYRNSARTWNTPDSATSNVGFRVVRDVGMGGVGAKAE